MSDEVSGATAVTAETRTDARRGYANEGDLKRAVIQLLEEGHTIVTAQRAVNVGTTWVRNRYARDPDFHTAVKAAMTVARERHEAAHSYRSEPT